MKLYFNGFRKWRIGIVISLLSLIVVSSCINQDDFDLDKVEGVEWTGSYALPILSSSLSINDLIPEEDSSFMKSDETGLIYFEYNEKVLNYDIRNFFQIPSRALNEEYSLPDIKLPSLSKTLELSVQQLTGNSSQAIPFPPIPATTPSPNSYFFPHIDDLVYVTFEEGSLSLTVVNNAAAPLVLDLELSNADGTAIGTFAFNVGSNGSAVSKNMSLAGLTIKNQVQVRIVSVSSPGSLSAFNPEDLIQISMNVSDYKASEGEIRLQEDLKVVASEPVDFDLSPEQLTEILLKGGSFNYTVIPGINYPAEASLVMPTMEQNGIPFSTTFQIENGREASGNLGLSNYKVNLTTLSPAYNRFPLHLEVVFKRSSATFKWKNTDRIQVQVGMQNLDFKYLKGFFGKKLIPLERHTFEIGVFNNTLNGYDISIHNPEISFNVSNEYGVPVRLDFKELQASNEGNSVNILTDPDSPIDLNFPASFGGTTAPTKLTIKNTQAVYELNPSAIAYQLDATLNNGLSSGANFLTDTSKVVVEMKAKVPLWGKAGNISLEDTMDNSLEGDIEEAKVEFVKIKTSIINEFPIDARVQIYFADENYIITDSLFRPEQASIIRSSEVNANGDLIKAGLYDQTIEVDKAKFEKMVKAPYLIIKGKLSTAEAAQKDVKIKTNYKLDVKLGLQTKLNVKVRF